MRASRLVLPPLLAGLVALGASGSGAVTAGVDVGSTAGLPSDVQPCSAGQTMFQGAVGAAPAYGTPAGVITSWSVMPSPSNPGIVSIRTARQGPVGTFTVTGASAPGELVTGRLNSFLTRIPVQAGDVLGIHAETVQPLLTAGCQFGTSDASDVITFKTGSSEDPVGTVVVTNDSDTLLRINVSARVEPDADGDGYGDLTQDACPSLKNSHDDCTPPDTFLKAGPAKRVTATGATAKVKVTFFASEPTTTFTCQLDKATAKPCKGTFKVKAKPGKHKVAITATDAVGNVDPTPLVVRFTVARATG